MRKDWQNRLEVVRKASIEFKNAQKQTKRDAWNEWDKIISYQVGDKVLLRTFVVLKKRSKKLTPKWTGPWEITGVIQGVTYRIKNCQNPKMKEQKAHMSRLKPFFQDISSIPREVEEKEQNSEIEDSTEEYEVETILQHRRKNKGYEYLVKWSGWTQRYNSWEPESNLSHSPEILKDYWRLKEK